MAPSGEAKRCGCKVGMTVAEYRERCPDLIVLLPAPDTCRYVHRMTIRLIGDHTPQVWAKSIDDFALSMAATRATGHGSVTVAQQIKDRPL